MDWHQFSLTACFAAVLITSCSGGGETLPPARLPALARTSATEVPIFHSGDKLELYVEEDTSFNAIYPVRPGGYILIPKIGRIQVEGLTRETAERTLTQAFLKGQLTKASVLVEHISGNYDRPGPPGVSKVMVFITGSVPRSGAHYLPVSDGKTMGVYETLLITGGISKFAHLGKVEVFRSDVTGRRVRSIVDIRPIRDGKADDPPVSDGDIIHVSEKVFGF